MAWWNRESAQQSGEALNTKAARMSPRFSYDALAKRLDAMPLSDALRASLKTSAQNIQGILNELIIRKSRKAVMADRWPDGFGYGETTFDRLAFMRAGSNDTDNPEIKKFNTPVAIPEHPSERRSAPLRGRQTNYSSHFQLRAQN